MARESKPGWQKDTVRERVESLFRSAGDCCRESPERARRYVEMAVKLCMRYNLTVPREYRGKYCRKCMAYLVPGLNAKARTSPTQKSVIVTCGECGHVRRLPYRKEKSDKQDI